MLQDERRHFSRIPFDAVVDVQQEDYKFKAQLIDLSLDGLLIKTPRVYRFSTDKPLDITVFLSDDDTITMKAELRHCSNTILGLKCISLDIESMTHLRQIVEMNIDAPNPSQRVLEELIKRIDSLK